MKNFIMKDDFKEYYGFEARLATENEITTSNNDKLFKPSGSFLQTLRIL